MGRGVPPRSHGLQWVSFRHLALRRGLRHAGMGSHGPLRGRRVHGGVPAWGRRPPLSGHLGWTEILGAGEQERDADGVARAGVKLAAPPAPCTHGASGPQPGSAAGNAAKAWEEGAGGGQGGARLLCVALTPGK